jgi:hypothetical protein
MRNAFKIFVGKPEGVTAIVRPGRRWDDTIKMYLNKIEWERVSWIHLAQERDRC